MVKDLPFTEIGAYRIFSEDVDPEELQWHWDEQDRIVVPAHETDWQFQFDNKLPEPMFEGVSIFIKEGQWHRIIKGTDSLTLHIAKL